jgi:hypothetical protein
VCVDANAGARAAARERAAQKDAIFAQQGLQFFNKETQLERTQNRNVIGLSRDQSDAYAGALAAQGKGRKQLENAARKYFRSKGTVNEGGRSRRFGVANYQGLLAAQSEVDSVIDNILGRNLAYAQQGAVRKFQAAQARGREALGIPAAYGAPVMMPPTNRLGGALQIASQVASIYSGFGGFGLGFGSTSTLASSASLGAQATALTGIASNPAISFGGLASDIKLKENVQHVGTSPQGYNIYEFNYKGGDVRFRGAMAQDVLQKNPMAVGIDQNYLTVDYRQIDVNMEVV